MDMGGAFQTFREVRGGKPTDVAAAASSTVCGESGIDVVDVSKTFGVGSSAVKALHNVSIAIPVGSFFTLLGPSGCGKTTLLRILAGFEHADAGRITLAGRDITGDAPNRRPVNTVFQSYALFPHLSVGRNVGFGLERQGWSRSDIASRTEAMLRLVRLDGMAARRPSELSGGQQQRVALARALAPGPKLLLLDEPLSALDVKLRRGMQIELKTIQRETGVTFLLVTHDQEEALSLSDQIAVMEAGRVLQVGDAWSIYERPRTRFVADFMGANVLPGALVGARSAYAAVRPERIVLTSEPVTGDLHGQVVEVTYLGARTNCRMVLDAGTSISVDLDASVPVRLGQRVTCRIPPDALATLDD